MAWVAAGQRKKAKCGHDKPDISCRACQARIRKWLKRGAHAPSSAPWESRVAVYMAERKGNQTLKCGHEPPQRDCPYCLRIMADFEWRRRNRKPKKGRPVQHNMVGETWGNLKVIAITKKRYAGHVIYVARCACGAEVEVRRNSLVTGNTTSCGCQGRGHEKRVATLGPKKLSEIGREAAKQRDQKRRDEALKKWRRDTFDK